MCGDGAAVLEELIQQYEVIDKQNEVGKEESMSVAAGSSIGGASIRIGGGKKRPSPESNSGVEGDSEVKKPKRERRKYAYALTGSRSEAKDHEEQMFQTMNTYK